MPVFKHDGSTLHYLVRGRGEPVLLIHGLGCSGKDWALQVKALEGRFRVIVPDLPGTGHSPPPHEGYSIPGFARTLWSLLDHLEILRPNIVGFSLGGAVGLEMALARPGRVPRLGLINSLGSYQIDHWRKWLEARIPVALVRLLGMRWAAAVSAARLFPKPWQRSLRAHATAVVGSVPSHVYLGMGLALQRWSALDRVHRLAARTLLIAAEHDFTPLGEKRALAARLGADVVVVRGSRHGTPFDAIEATNAILMALLSDQPLPSAERWTCDSPSRSQALNLEGSIAEEHALARSRVNLT